MSKLTPKQQSIAYWGAHFMTKLAQGWSESTIRGQLVFVVEYTESLTLNDIDTIVEVAQGKRCA